MRKHFFILTVLLILMYPATAFAESFQEAVRFANNDISMRYKYPGDFFNSRNANGASLNQNAWKNPINIGGVTVRTFAYGNPWETIETVSIDILVIQKMG